jgi:hypothetical protein
MFFCPLVHLSPASPVYTVAQRMREIIVRGFVVHDRIYSKSHLTHIRQQLKKNYVKI